MRVRRQRVNKDGSAVYVVTLTAAERKALAPMGNACKLSGSVSRARDSRTCAAIALVLDEVICGDRDDGTR